MEVSQITNLVKDFQINLDLIKNLTNPTIQVKETDLNSVKFSFTITDNEVPVNLTGTVVQLSVKKPSSLTVVQNCDILDPLNGTCEILLMNQAYLEIGNYSGEIVITKNESIVVTNSFEYRSLSAILGDGALESTNDWQVFHDILYSYDKKPILGETDPNTIITPEYIGQSYFDTLGNVFYYASTIANDSWKPFGTVNETTGAIEITDVNGLTQALAGKSDTTHTHAGTYYPANGGNLNGSVTITNKGDMVNQLRFNTDRPWTFKQKGVDTTAELILTPDANTKTFRITSPLGTDALEVKVDDTKLNAYVNIPRIKEDGTWLFQKYIVSSGNVATTIWRGTQASYDAIGTKDANTLYFITG